MARKRMIDPSLWQDEEFGSLSSNAKILFIGLFSNADDEGRIRANTAYLKSTVFMYDNISQTQIKAIRDEVAEKMTTVQLYQVEGKDYIQLKNWSEYQKQHKDRVQESTLPPYDSGVSYAQTSFDTNVSDNDGQVTDNDGVSKDKLSKIRSSKVPANAVEVLQTSGIVTEETKPKKVNTTNQVISLFKPLNENFDRLFKNKTEREAVGYMEAKWSISTIAEIIQDYLKFRGEDGYPPSISRPTEFLSKYEKLVEMIKRGKKRESGLGIQSQTDGFSLSVGMRPANSKT